MIAPAVNPLIAGGVLVCTAVTDAVYVMFNAAVSGRRRVAAANWSGIWYLLSAFAVISYTQNAFYVLFAAAGSWVGAYASMTWLQRNGPPGDGGERASTAGTERALRRSRPPSAAAPRVPGDRNSAGEGQREQRS